MLDRLDGIRERLYQVRERRLHPLRDDKVLTSWNGMMIRALAEAADALAEPSYAEAAARAAAFLWRHNRRDDGGLWRVWLDGEASTSGLVQDYAHLAHAFVALHDVTPGEQVARTLRDRRGRDGRTLLGSLLLLPRRKARPPHRA